MTGAAQGACRRQERQRRQRWRPPQLCCGAGARSPYSRRDLLTLSPLGMNFTASSSPVSSLRIKFTTPLAPLPISRTCSTQRESIAVDRNDRGSAAVPAEPSESPTRSRRGPAYQQVLVAVVHVLPFHSRDLTAKVWGKPATAKARALRKLALELTRGGEQTKQTK